jgi:hypothetical protein
MNRLAAPVALGACVMVFYWVPMTSSSASIQWDAADVHYPMQKYFSDRFSPRQLPFWTPYVLAGYPLLANPEVGAWYPPNWPFLLAGITPRAIQLELAFNAFLACLGAYLLISRHVENRMAAIVGAFAYGLSGFFAGHASHMSQFTAAMFPWLLVAYRRAIDIASVRYTAFGGLVGAALILAGSGQAAVYSFLGLGLYAFADWWRERQGWLRNVAIIGFMLAGALACAAIQLLPAQELAGNFSRAADSSTIGEGVLHPGSLMTLVAPDWLGAISGGFKGPSGITQFYFYSGLFVLPLAVIGAVKSGVRLPGLLLIVPPVWYMLGPAGGLYYLGTLAPILHKSRGPVEGWFLVALGLALLAAAGGEWIFARWRFPYLPVLVAGLLFMDVWYWNSLGNPLAYAHASFDELYGSSEETGRIRVAMNQPQLTRFYAPGDRASMGPMLHPLDVKLEAIYGSWLLDPGPYRDYLDAMERNLKLRDGLNVSRFMNVATGRIDENGSVRPRAYFPKAVVDATSLADSRRALETLDPAASCVVLSPHPFIRQDPEAAALVDSFGEQWYRIHYHAVSPSLLKVSAAWYPGWRADLGGKPLPIVRVDHALMGVIVPAGDNEIALSFYSNRFGSGLAISLVSGFLLLVCMRGGRSAHHKKRKKRRRSERMVW